MTAGARKSAKRASAEISVNNIISSIGLVGVKDVAANRVGWGWLAA